MIVYRRATNDDYPGILALQDEFYLDNRPAGDRQRGFLSARMDLATLARVNDAMGMLVAVDADRVVGFLGLTPFDAPASSSVVAALQKAALRLEFHGGSLAGRPVFIFGPVCIAATHQGCGIFKGLYRFMWAWLDPRQYSIGLAFVARDNPHSLAVHCKGLGAELLGGFTAGRHPFWLIALSRP